MKYVTHAHKIILRYKTSILFLISGTSAAMFQLAMYAFLSRVIGMQYLMASSIAFCAALVVSFLLQKYVTFQNKDLRVATQFVQFAALAICNLSINTLLMYMLVEKLQIYDVFAQAITMITIAIWSFFIYKYHIFKV
jgi:putative flippase GtrA